PLQAGGTFVDATLGRGGHARAVLAAAPAARLIGIDRDPDALEASGTYLASFGDRVRLVRDNFEELASVLERLGNPTVRGVLFDLGVASSQLDEASRGFSFRHDGPLDMRMDPSAALNAADVVNRYPIDQLERVIRVFGEERFARRIARAIERERPIEGTVRLAAIVKDAIPAATRRTGGHPARRTFQAIRIEVNGEIRALEAALPAAVEGLDTGGRLAVISYHSLEDRAVKRFFNDEAGRCVCPPDLPVCACGANARVRVLTARPVRPAAGEVAVNPRARAAKLRVAERMGGRGRR
ncbi:MAG: 16S rRNA (cytosine(1402)-N(4))-methyltransferase RsmH, partial [Actinomycetota bacterium]